VLDTNSQSIIILSDYDFISTPQDYLIIAENENSEFETNGKKRVQINAVSSPRKHLRLAMGLTIDWDTLNQNKAAGNEGGTELWKEIALLLHTTIYPYQIRNELLKLWDDIKHRGHGGSRHSSQMIFFSSENGTNLILLLLSRVDFKSFEQGIFLTSKY
jgi:hypothetical protein